MAAAGGAVANRSAQEPEILGTIPAGSQTPLVGQSSGRSMLNLRHALPPALATLALLAVVAARADQPDAAGGQPEGAKAAGAPAQHTAAVLDGRDGRDLVLDRFRPQAMLRVDEHLLGRAKFPVVDVHFHPRVRFHENSQMLDDFVKVMDRQNIAVCVSLDGRMGEQFIEHSHYLWDKYRDRFVIFANVDWQGSGQAGDPATWDCRRPISATGWPGSWPRPRPPAPAG